MAAISGDLTDQLGIKKETTWGTPVTVDRFFPIIPGDGFDGGPEALMGAGVYAGKVSPQLENAVLGNESYKGTYQMEVYDHSQGLLYEAMLGAVSSSGAGPYTRTFTPAEPLPSYTMQEVFADNTGTLRALTYSGCVCEAWEVNFEPGKIVTLGMDWSAKSETNATAVATAAYSTTPVPVVAQNVAVTFGGSTVNLKNLKLRCDNALSYDERRFLGSATVGRQQISKEVRKFTSEGALELENAFTEYLKYKANTFFAVVVTCTVGSNTITFTMSNTRYTGSRPKTGTGVTEQPIKMEHVEWGAFKQVQIVTVNSDTVA
jgi:hypothetical protein